MRTFATSILAVVAAILVGAFVGASVALTFSPPGRRPDPSELEAFLFVGVLGSGIILGLWRRRLLPSTLLGVAAISLVTAGGAILLGPSPLSSWRVVYAMLIFVLPLALGLTLATVITHVRLSGSARKEQKPNKAPEPTPGAVTPRAT